MPRPKNPGEVAVWLQQHGLHAHKTMGNDNGWHLVFGESRFRGAKRLCGTPRCFKLRLKNVVADASAERGSGETDLS